MNRFFRPAGFIAVNGAASLWSGCGAVLDAYMMPHAQWPTKFRRESSFTNLSFPDFEKFRHFSSSCFLLFFQNMIRPALALV